MVKQSFISQTWRLTRVYWRSKEKWGARLLLAVIVGLTLGNVYILVLLNAWNNRFYNALQNYDKGDFFSALGQFSILAGLFIIIAVYEQYLQQMLEIKWRRWLTEHYLGDWMEGQTYYRLQLVDNNTDNPDQRISEDLQQFVSLTLRLSLGLLKASVTLVSFVVILWTLSGTLTVPLGGSEIAIPGYMVWVAIIYAAVGTWLTSKIGRPLVGINFNQQRFEADFRFSLVRLRENSESIAFYKGERQEQQNFAKRFEKVFGNFRQLMNQQKKLTWFTAGYSQIAIIFPFVVAAPRYFSNQIQLGGLVQTASAFGRVQDALSFFVESYSVLAQWQAVVNRLTGFVNNMEQVRTMPRENLVQIHHDAGPAFAVAGLNVGLPDGTRLLTGLELRLNPGDSLLITGPSGCGKSTLMRTLAGIWPFGEGSIRIPRGQRVLFLPQKSYLPLGTLRDAILYPHSAGWATDEVIARAMELCKLGEWVGQLDRMENWAQVLSLGEQQRVAFARVILQKPQWLFLDEATSALDEPTESAMYELLREELQDPAIISVGHRQTLVKYHRSRLRIDKKGDWNLAG
ncbi:MAG: ABC transporter ATP-binding protein/permease [Negativicutes bacterium]|nr:ABC transporter ATP-binding protein/permease [Negativicutes bacterium]